MRRLLSLIAVAAATAVSGCASVFNSFAGEGPPPLFPLPFPVDTALLQLAGQGVWHRYVYSPKGPWAIHILDVDLNKCNAAVAVKGADSAAGRTKTSVLLDDLAKSRLVSGGVNADFFTLANGVPLGLLISDGHMLTPPNAEPSLAFDSTGMAAIVRFTKKGTTLAPFYPREAVGGRTELIRDSVILVAPDTANEPSFVARNPRTAAGISRNGRRLILVTIDGRQKPYSDGATLHETAEILRALGAYDALNLDGGGSTTLVARDPLGALRIANHPSDKEGERPVGDALAIVRRCAQFP